MESHDFLSAYDAHAAEYLIGVGSLIFFAFFWRYLNGAGPAEATVSVRDAVPEAASRMVEGFALPEALFFHPGHVWLRAEADGVVAVGLDDFGHRLVGSMSGLRMPAVGAEVRQGEPTFAIEAGARQVELLSPVDGQVVAVNAQAQASPAELAADPYGQGWLVKVKAPRLAANLRQLLSGNAAQRWLEAAAEALRARLSPQLGTVLQDGGTPVHGIARELDPQGWDALARSFFLT